ncbi:uncharacterized protein ISCGN_011660 [Ixodes scapularis]
MTRVGVQKNGCTTSPVLSATRIRRREDRKGAIFEGDERTSEQAFRNAVDLVNTDAEHALSRFRLAGVVQRVARHDAFHAHKAGRTFVGPQGVDCEGVELNDGLGGSKQRMAPTTAGQLADGCLEERFMGRTRCYMDGSVDPDARTVTATAVSTDIGARAVEHLSFACSTTAEVAALRRALSLAEAASPPERLIILSNSKAALTQLANLNRAPPLARVVANAAIMLQRQEWRLVFQFLPVHCGIKGNEEADRLAASAQGDDACPTSSVAAFSDAGLLVRRAIRVRHPELENGPMPPRRPRNLTRKDAAAMDKLRTNIAFIPGHLARWRADRGSRCPRCDEERAGDARIVLRCDHFTHE